MKLKHIAALVAAASMMAPAAHASKSRLGALEGAGAVDGSFFIADERAVFLSPAFAGSFGNNINMELGTGQGGTTQPVAEGGFLMPGDSLSYGVQLGRTGFAAQNLAARGAGELTGWDANTANLIPQNSLELMLAGSGGWGVSLHYVNSTDDNAANATGNEIDQAADIMTLKAGYMTDKWHVVAHFDITATQTSNEEDAGGEDETLDASGTMRLGGYYNLDENSTIGGLLQMNQVKAEGSLEAEYSDTDLILEYFRKLKNEEGTMAYYKVGVRYLAAATEPDGGDEGTATTLAIPVTIGVETKMEDWLTFRGSINQNVIVDSFAQEDVTADVSRTRTNNVSNTTVAAGVGMTWGGLRIDSQLAALIDPNATGTDTSGTINGDNLLARVGFNYQF